MTSVIGLGLPRRAQLCSRILFKVALIKVWSLMLAEYDQAAQRRRKA
jgi:hypothetical protein